MKKQFVLIGLFFLVVHTAHPMDRKRKREENKEPETSALVVQPTNKKRKTDQNFQIKRPGQQKDSISKGTLYYEIKQLKEATKSLEKRIANKDCSDEKIRVQSRNIEKLKKNCSDLFSENRYLRDQMRNCLEYYYYILSNMRLYRNESPSTSPNNEHKSRREERESRRRERERRRRSRHKSRSHR